MLILISCLLLFITALALVVLRVVQPNVRYAWLVATGGGVVAFGSVFVWLTQMPFDFTLPAWQPVSLFPSPILFRADGISWALSISIAALTVAFLLTSVTGSIFTNSLAWTGALALSGMGILAVTANNPLTLLLVWASLDITELVTQLSSVQGRSNNERVVISFSTRVLGISFLIMGSIVSMSGGGIVDFQSMSANSTIYLVIAAGLRLGVIPLHLPYSADSSLRRGFGTALRLIGTVSSLSILGRIQTLTSGFTPILMLLASVAAVYGGWMWLRAPDELNGRPYWVIGVASLSVLVATSGNPTGAVAWGCALLLTGGVLFLSSVQNTWLNRSVLVGVWSLSSLPFSLTASGWLGTLGLFFPLAIISQVFLITGFIRHALRLTGRESLDAQPGWTRAVYPAGLILLLVMQILLGLIGWNGALQVGAWLAALLASTLTVGLFFASRRFRIFNPMRAHWVTNTEAGVNRMYQGLWWIYHALARVARGITLLLEGEGSIMWTILFLILFISIIVQGVS